MPEARDWVVWGEGVAEGELAGGFLILRVASPVARAEPRRVGSRGVADGKENIPPWAATQRRKSPLPEWYPRTPFRDITVVVNALEKRSRLRAARAGQRDHDPEATPQPTLPTNASPQEQSVSEQTPQEPGVSEQTPVNQFLPSDTSDTSSTPMVAPPSPIEHPQEISSSFSSLTLSEQQPQTASVSTNLTPNDLKPNEHEKLSRSIEHSLQISSSLGSLSPTEHPPEITSVSVNQAHQHESKPTEYEKQLLNAIDEIERVVMKNLKRNPKVPGRNAAQKSALMALR